MLVLKIPHDRSYCMQCLHQLLLRCVLSWECYRDFYLLDQTKPKLSPVVGMQSRKPQLSSGQLILRTNLCIESLPDLKISAIVKASI